MSDTILVVAVPAARNRLGDIISVLSLALEGYTAGYEVVDQVLSVKRYRVCREGVEGAIVTTAWFGKRWFPYTRSVEDVVFGNLEERG